MSRELPHPPSPPSPPSCQSRQSAGAQLQMQRRVGAPGHAFRFHSGLEPAGRAVWHLYEIRIEGVLEPGLPAAWFEGLQITTNGGETVISGQLADQAALHGLLTRVRDLGLSRDGRRVE